MSMQDKDLDQLFRSQLDSYEVEPSSRVWAGIAEGLDAGEGKKAGFPFLRVAASVTILATASYIFWPKADQQNANDNPKQMASVVKTAVKPVQPQPVVVEEQPVDNEPVKQDQQVKPAAAQVQAQQAIAAVKQAPVQQIQQTPAVNTQPATTVVDPTPTVVVAAVQQQQQILAANTAEDTKPSIKVLPETNFLPTKADLNDSKPTAVMASADQTSAEGKPAKKNRIRGLGGLLNAAISLVDRRDDKIVEFTNNEDGDTITGINLGIVSFKKEKK